MQWRRWTWGVLFTAAVLTTPAKAESSAPALVSSAPVASTLSNGLRLVVRVDRSVPLVAIDLRYGIGEAMDPPGLAGLADGVARMLRKGESRHLGRGEVERIVRAAHLEPYHSDVDVTLDATHVTSTVPPDGLEVALWLEAERMRFASGPVGLGRLTGISVPLLMNLDAIVRRSEFGPAHPYFTEIPNDTGDALSAAFTAGWRAAWYTPSNATMMVAGNVDPELVRRLVGRYFGSIAGAPVSHPPSPAPTLVTPLVRIDARVTSPALVVAWRSPSGLALDDLELCLAARILEKRLVDRFDKRGHAEHIMVAQRGMQLGGLFTVYADVDEERWEAMALDGIDEEVRRVGAGDFGDAELMLAKRHAQLAAASERDTLWTRARLDNEAFAVTGLTDPSPQLFRRLAAIDKGAVAAAVTRNLTAPMRVVVRITPKPNAPNGGIASDEELHRLFHAPALTAAPPREDAAGTSYHLPGKTQSPGVPMLRTVELPSLSGIRVQVVTRPDLPLVRFRVFAPLSEAFRTLAEVRALPELLAMTLVDGQALETRLSALGVEPEFSGDVAGTSVVVSATPDAVEEALGLVVTALGHPSLSADPVNELRRRLSTAWRAEFEVTWRRKSEHISDVVGPYMAGTPDVPTTLPFKASVIDSIARTAWSPHLTVSFVGAISADAASRVVKNALHRPPQALVTVARHADERATRKYDLVENDRTNDVSLSYSCVLPDAVVSRSAAAMLPAFLSEAFATLRGGGNAGRNYAPGIFSHSEEIDVVRLEGATLFHLGYMVRDERDAVKRSVEHVFARAEALERGEPGAELEIPLDQLADIRRGGAEWLVGGFDSTAQQLDSLYELGPDALSFFSAVPFNLSPVEVRVAVRRCFDKDVLHVSGYGHVQAVAAVLSNHGYGPVHVDKAPAQ